MSSNKVHPLEIPPPLSSAMGWGPGLPHMSLWSIFKPQVVVVVWGMETAAGKQNTALLLLEASSHGLQTLFCASIHVRTSMYFLYQQICFVRVYSGIKVRAL